MPPYDMIPVDCYPWIVAALFIGLAGREGLQKAISLCRTVRAVPQSNSSGDGRPSSDERAESRHAIEVGDESASLRNR